MDRDGQIEHPQSSLDASLHGDGTLPYIMHLSPDFAIFAVSEANAFQTTLAFFIPDFLQSHFRKEHGRAAQDMDSSASEAFLSALLPLLPAHHGNLTNEEPQDLRSSLQGNVFGLAPNNVRTYMEKGFMAGMKVCVKGTRSLLLFDLISTHAAMEAYYTGDGAPPRPCAGGQPKAITPSVMQSF